MTMTRSTLLVLAGLLVFVATARADEKGVQYDPQKAFEQTDVNGDGYVDRREFHVRIVEIFFHADSDKDGYMTWTELRGAVAFPDDFKGADTDGDGRIALHEFIEVRFQDYPIADSDGDGRLSLEEVVAIFEQGGVGK
jgi:Ca2+-binding EF-hand superfamily protein